MMALSTNHPMALLSFEKKLKGGWKFESKPEIMQRAIRVFLSTIEADITDRNPTNNVARIE